MHVYYLPESLFCSSDLDLYRKNENRNNEEDVQCYDLTSRWKYMYIKWVSQRQRAFTAVPGPTFSFKQYSFWKTVIHFKLKTTTYVVGQNILSIP